MKFGIVVFRWAVLVSVIVAFSSISLAHKGLMVIPDIAYALMRSVSILELCLLGFLCLSMNALRLSVRDMAFGIALGFGLMSGNDLVQSLVISARSSLTSPWQFVYESVILASLGTWVTYCVLPEPARMPVVVPASSAIYRWNEIASALGHTGTQVAVQQPANSFFLTDVEKVVEKVISRNLKDRESES
jgi:multidrug transporter EmrE-like cation transporter